MQINVKCPSCNTESSFFVDKNVFEGPFRCRDCKSLFTVKVQNGQILLCEPLSQEDFDKKKTAKEAKKKAKK